uniref:Movement protein n=1 Tax=Passion fruit green spot virus TaxID=989895 RepID=A0A5P9KGE4_9VIRU|nr:movement protein [Passion fruit green spot virus]QIH54361.1 movement protein [Passion fruit green spot virus]WBV73451.1 movement protein [Passion fruit green spot virus]
MAMIGADDFSELESILNANYDEEGVFKASKSVCLRTSKRVGIGFLTPNDFISRINGFIRRKAEDAGLRNVESFRQLSDVVIIIVPQVAFPATLTLKLVDSCNALEAIFDQSVVVNSTSGPQIAIFNSGYSIPNEDRVSVGGNESHRRLGLSYEIEHSENISGGHITTFALTLLWREAFYFQPSNFKVHEPRLIPITVGYKKAQMSRSHADLKRAISRGMVTTGHSSVPSIRSERSISVIEKKRVTAPEQDIVVEEIDSATESKKPSSSQVRIPPRVLKFTTLDKYEKSDNGPALS